MPVPAKTIAKTYPTTDRFLEDTLRGLRRPRKRLLSKYLYDERGSRLFERICKLPEYYLNDAEMEIILEKGAEFGRRMGPCCALVELGSGSGAKTRELLNRLPELATYVPVDISKSSLRESAASLASRFPGLEVLPVSADFTRPFRVPEGSHQAWRRVVFFPGSTIGNFTPRQSVCLLRRLAKVGGLGAGLLIGVDLKKDPAVLQAAYNDSQGVTAEFNYNLLARINRELGGDFDLEAFAFRAPWNPRKGRIESYLVSRRPQTVTVAGERFELRRGERINTEYSYKYTVEEFQRLAGEAGFQPVETWLDRGGRFSVQYFHVNGQAS